MKDFADSFGVAACGLVTSILTALAIVVVAKMTGFNFFTFSIWFVVPAGALLTGLAAASGYYFGSLYFHKRASPSLLVQMVVIAGLTQLLIYYMGYSTLVLDNGQRVSDLIPFRQYLDISLTSAHYRVGRARTDTGEVGSIGYWLAALQFVGFLVGGLVLYVVLTTKAICEKCNLYLRPLSNRNKVFRDGGSASLYYDVLFQHPVGGPEFAALIRSEEKAKIEKGAVMVKTALHGCPKCKSQLIEEEVHVWAGNSWQEANQLKRRVPISDGVDLLRIFKP